MRNLVLAAALATLALPVLAQPAPPPDPGVPPAVAPHCLSRQPGRLALTPDQLARIDELVRSEPDGQSRRAEIIRVLTMTQRMVYYDLAGVAAC